MRKLRLFASLFVAPCASAFLLCPARTHHKRIVDNRLSIQFPTTLLFDSFRLGVNDESFKNASGVNADNGTVPLPISIAQDLNSTYSSEPFFKVVDAVERKAETQSKKRWYWPFRRNKKSETPTKPPAPINVASVETSSLNAKTSVSNNAPMQSRKTVPTPARKKKSLFRRITRAFVRFAALAFVLLIFSPFAGDDFNPWQDSVSAPIQQLQMKKPIQLDKGDLRNQASQTGENAAGNTKEEASSGPKKDIDNLSPEKLVVAAKTDSESSSESTAVLVERKALALAFVTEAVEKIGPSVIRVDTETPVPEEGTIAPTGVYIQQAHGSGVIFSKSGLILTNAHVVADASKVSVTLTDGRIYRAEVKGVDEIIDIAVIKIICPIGETLADLPVAELGDSDSLNVGQLVLAVGSPGTLQKL
jgi:hypothetical protein